MRIAVIYDSFEHDTGGVYTSVTGFIEPLMKRHHIIFISGRHPKETIIGHYKKIKIYRFSGFKNPKKNDTQYYALPSKHRIIQLLKKEDIQVIYWVFPTPLSIITSKAAHDLGIPLIAHMHTQAENNILLLPKIFSNKMINNIFYKYCTWLYKKADITICPSRFAEKLIRSYDPTINTEVISNGVDLSVFKKYKQKKSRMFRRLLFVGNLQREKNVETLIEAMAIIIKKMKNVRLDIVGAGEMKDDLKTLTESLKLSDFITFRGRISRSDLVKAYNACDIFVLPSIAELEGIVALEAMACGKPLLVSDSENSATRFLINNNGSLFRSGDPSDLSKKAITMLSDEKLMKKFSLISLKKVKKFSLELSTEKLEKLFIKVSGK